MKKILLLLIGLFLISLISLPTTVFSEHREIHLHIWIIPPTGYTPPIYHNYKGPFIYNHFYYPRVYPNLLRNKSYYNRYQYPYYYPPYFLFPYYRSYYYNYYVDP